MNENNEIQLSDVAPDTLTVKEGGLERVIRYLQSNPIKSDPHIIIPRLLIETENTEIEITATDGDLEIREVRADESEESQDSK